MTIINIIKLPAFLYILKEAQASVGDNSPFYINCVKECEVHICKPGKHLNFQYNILGFHFSLWSCTENCEYDCQWKTVESFRKKDWSIPQFKGKWPFVRFLGFQEPASVIFSILNFFVIMKLLVLFRKKVPRSSQYYNVWNAFGLIQLNSWFWSSIYHSRDTDFTERMDYMAAFLLILYSFYAMGLRYMGTSINSKTIFWSLFCGSLCINHLAYLWLYNFDYGYNMKLSCLLGGITVLGWFLWSFLHYQSQFFVWKVFLFALLVAVTTFLELLDFPPILWIVDAHALWHGSSLIVNVLFFHFIIDDCKHLNYTNFKKN